MASQSSRLNCSFLAFVIGVTVFYMVTSISTVYREIFEKDKPLIRAFLSHKAQFTDFKTTNRSVTKVLLQAYYRGGSSFLGSMFGKNAKVFYWFEPLHALMATRNTGNFNDKVKDDSFRILSNGSISHLPLSAAQERTLTLKSAFQCSVDGLDDKVLTDWAFVLGHHMPKFRKYSRCVHQKHPPPNIYRKCSVHIRRPCKSSNVIAVKTIRYPTYMLTDLLKIFPDLKMIHYTRDPRGIMTSRMEIHRFSRNMLFSQTKVLCSQMAVNYKTFKKLQNHYPDNCMVLKYEDLARKPHVTAHMIYDFIGHEFPPELSNWISDITQAKQADETYGIRRNSSATVHKWRRMLSRMDSDHMTAICNETLELLGYSETNRRLTPFK